MSEIRVSSVQKDACMINFICIFGGHENMAYWSRVKNRRCVFIWLKNVRQNLVQIVDTLLPKFNKFTRGHKNAKYGGAKRG